MKKLPKWMTTVTPFSFILAAVLFVILPFISFYIGLSLGIVQNNTRYILSTIPALENISNTTFVPTTTVIPTTSIMPIATTKVSVTPSLSENSSYILIKSLASFTYPISLSFQFNNCLNASQSSQNIMGYKITAETKSDSAKIYSNIVNKLGNNGYKNSSCSDDIDSEGTISTFIKGNSKIVVKSPSAVSENQSKIFVYFN